MNRVTFIVLLAVMVVLLSLAVAFNWINLSEAYGSGPPYYNRTANMDKWISPVPVLVAVDALMAVVVALVIYWVRCARRS
ncbi:hypothetical protein LMG28688_00317 [Paraburkholderia caffeinitolerans]|uniref:Uncharacterized protein n=1 Tax=Paraburkholderia caffeinitolerans TaxID=1723730 RepID=A0A6J5FER1_9BURK|nr:MULTISPECIES: hypothetical protein [Paraburkholderia]CAB3776857.1 hypothetical protein LMG28688_00317 [Paraburkholderia caffeinitolerans]